MTSSRDSSRVTVPLAPFLQRSGVNQCGFPPVRKLFLTPADMGELSTFDWKSHHGLLLGRERLPKRFVELNGHASTLHCKVLHVNIRQSAVFEINGETSGKSGELV